MARPKKKLTVEQLMLVIMSQDINQWLHETKGGSEGAPGIKYFNYMDRVADIHILLKESLEKTAKRVEESGEEWIEDWDQINGC